MPSFGFSWVQVKPDYIVRPECVVLLFVTVGIGSGKRGNRFVAVFGSPDAGLTWNYLAPIIATSADAHYVNRYYASPVLLNDGRILVALRCQIDARNAWPEIFESCDGGRSWHFSRGRAIGVVPRSSPCSTTGDCWRSMDIASCPMAYARASQKMMAKPGDPS